MMYGVRLYIQIYHTSLSYHGFSPMMRSSVKLISLSLPMPAATGSALKEGRGGVGVGLQACLVYIPTYIMHVISTFKGSIRRKVF